MVFKAVKFAQLLCGAYILIVTFTYAGKLAPFGGARDPESGFIVDSTSEENTNAGVVLWNGDLRAVVAATRAQMVLLGISRFSGFFMYPCLILVFLTKLRATGAFLSGTLFNMFLYQDMHRLHVYCGWVILFDSCVHMICHLSRWALQGNLRLLFQHTSGITGFIVILSTFLICLPMMIWKDRIKYELRKLAHYLFLVFGVAMCFHAPKSAIPNGGFCGYIFPILLVWYGIDTLFCALFMTELIETTSYHTLPSGVQMSMNVSKRFQGWRDNGGYAYICFPWVDRHQWHAFSLFENPNNPDERQIFMHRTGDWTNGVHELLQRDSVRPVWVQGPFPSPYKIAIKYDNQILVAGGIGITPALSVIRAHQDSRCINLIWAVRDQAMLQFFLEHAYLHNRGWSLIFYTGKQPLLSSLIDGLTGTNMRIIHSRPKLDQVIPNIIYGFESGEGLPGRYLPDQKTEAVELLRKRLDDLDCDSETTHKEKICNLAQYAKQLGYIFYDLMHHLDDIQSKESSSTEYDWSTSDEEHDPESGLLAFDQLEDEAVKSVDESVLLQLRKYRFHRRASNQCTTDRRDSNGPMARRPTLGSTRSSSSVGSVGGVHQRKSVVFDFQRSELMDNTTQNFKAWEEHLGAASYVKNLDPQLVKSTWGIMYCGGKNSLLKSVEKVSKEVGIKLHSESFEW
jgi:ferric-chelate reductase